MIDSNLRHQLRTLAQEYRGTYREVGEECEIQFPSEEALNKARAAFPVAPTGSQIGDEDGHFLSWK